MVQENSSKAMMEPCARCKERQERWFMEGKEARVAGAPCHAEEFLTICDGMAAAARLQCLRHEKDRNVRTTKVDKTDFYFGDTVEKDPESSPFLPLLLQFKLPSPLV